VAHIRYLNFWPGSEIQESSNQLVNLRASNTF